MKTLNRIKVLLVKELLQLLRDKVLVIATIYLFTVDIFLAASGVNLTLNRVSFKTLDFDKTSVSRDLIDRFRPPYFEYRGEVPRRVQAEELLEQGKILAYLEIPDGFEQSLKTNQKTQVLLLVDTSNAIMGYLIAGYSAGIVAGFSQEKSLETLGLMPEMIERLPLVEGASRVLFNPNQEETWFNALSELLTVITLLTMLLPAAALVREKERGTIEQLLVSPARPLEILLAKIFAMTLVILLGVLAATSFIIKGTFHIPMRGSLPVFLMITCFYVFTSSGYGLLIGGIANNLAQVGLLTIIAIAPIVFLSGTWTPPEAMPFWLSSMMSFSPLFYFIQMAYGLFFKGVGWDFLLPKIAKMLALGFLVLWGSAFAFKRRFF
ncbi:ABC transporter permease [Thermodesulfatator atlanticus]|uniref:ABC transporter permease n=1 Tax=Thermodesulfatator atlanticus TaxID=501497 RepID=UPI0003B5DA6D|nr:ABC transporter permease [Thermodesulfatator atlanticus]